ncbi:helix-turn-helix domain-containing protein [Roseivivax sp. CAU 1753]
MTVRPYSPAQLAERWNCSAETVRTFLKSGRLKGFRIGRQFRIPAASVEEFETCQTMPSSVSAAGSPLSSTKKMASGGAIVLRHAPERKPRQPRGM